MYIKAVANIQTRHLWIHATKRVFKLRLYSNSLQYYSPLIY